MELLSLAQARQTRAGRAHTKKPSRCIVLPEPDISPVEDDGDCLNPSALIVEVKKSVACAVNSSNDMLITWQGIPYSC